MKRPMPANDTRRGKRERGSCGICGADVSLRSNGMPYKHDHATFGVECAGSECFGRFSLMSEDEGRFLQTMDAWHDWQKIGDLVERILR